MKVTVKFFASVRDVIGERSQTIDVADDATVGSVWQVYAARYPRLASMGLVYTVNHEHSKPDRVLKDGDELAMIPPVSGG